MTNVSKDVEEQKSLYITGRNAKWYSPCGKQFGGSSKG